MFRRPPNTTRTDSLLPYTPRLRSIVCRLRIAAGDGFGHQLGRLGLCLGLTLARLGVAERGFAPALGLQYLALLLALGAQDFRRPHPFGLENVGALLALGLHLPRHRVRNIGGRPDIDRKSTRLNSSHYCASRMPSSA